MQEIGLHSCLKLFESNSAVKKRQRGFFFWASKPQNHTHPPTMLFMILVSGG